MKFRIFKNSNDNDYLKALKIYVDNIKDDWRTNTNEITFWLDNYNNKFDDNFYLVGIYNDSMLIGFLQFAYFLKNKIVFIDYITIDESYRVNNTFIKVVKEFFIFLDTNKILYTYLLCEVENHPDNKRSLVRLYNRFGFNRFEPNYKHPFLNINYAYSELEYDINTIPYALMVYTKSNIKEISKFEYNDIINTIYINHYKRWYTDFLNNEQLKEYSYHIDLLKADVINDIESNKINYIKIV